MRLRIFFTHKEKWIILQLGSPWFVKARRPQIENMITACVEGFLMGMSLWALLSRETTLSAKDSLLAEPSSKSWLWFVMLVTHCLSHLTKFGQALTDSFWHLFFVRGRRFFKKNQSSLRPHGIGERKKQKLNCFTSDLGRAGHRETDSEISQWLVWIIEECGLISLSADI